MNQVIYVSATPGPYELTKSACVVVEQIIRPTGLLDPQVDTHDWNMLDNRKKLGFQLFGSRPVDNYLDTWFSTPVHRDRLSNGVLPAVWYNDAGGITLGLRSRSDYFGRFERDVRARALGHRRGGEGHR